MMGIKTTAWDVTAHLDSEEKIAAYLDAVFEEGDFELIKAAIGDVARARGMTEVANNSGITRAGLYKALGEGGNPSLATVLSVLKTMGVQLRAAPASNDAGPAPAVRDRAMA
ncbi:addiction module antidote protein [Sphingomonas sp. 10B4]|uniref:addiction module antidote protein n=1 Tax=Sphingomonas sp. 10B4 TaxID=3048575 RepID=UPI002AB4EC00|nr:addiction module antidote protein [Sphingomonas sp. 10B4]MDY7525373.1 putative addiction module antidote protein [Sphingomonas sp. 10B4]MEB0284175.1 putative addiction module antidote protein [Sphingomonas sp. 10B4]